MFSRRRRDDDDAFLAHARDEIASLASEEPSRELFDRIAASRARGERVILPAVDEASTRATRAPLAWAAAILVIASGALVVARGNRGDRDLDSIVSASAFIGTADAAELPSRQEPLAPSITQVDGTRLHVGRLEFAQRWTDGKGRQQIDARSSFDVSASVVNGTQAWRVVSIVTGRVGGHGETMEAETLFVARDDLRPLRRLVHASPYNKYSRINIAQDFHGDSVIGHMSAEGADGSPAGRSIAQKLPAAFAPYISETLAPLYLSAVTITPTFSRSLSLLGWAVRPYDVYASMTLRYSGEEWITVPAGRFDCWRLELSVSKARVSHWVRKSDGVGILTRDETKKTTRGVREYLLVRD